MAARKTGSFKQPAGSPSSGEPDYLVVGKLRRPHGLHGEMVLEVITDFPERLKRGSQVYLGEEHTPIRLRSRRPHAEGLLIAFEGYDTPESVGALRNVLVYTAVADLPPLPEGEYYHHQMIGLNVISDDGRDLGRLTEIMTTAANDVYVVRSETGQELLLPAIDEVIVAIDLQQKQITVHLLPGI